MKKRILTLTLITGLMLGAAACGKTETVLEAESQVTSDNTVKPAGSATVANPWRDCTEEEASQFAPNGFSAPEGATNVKWSIMEQPIDALPGTMVQLSFDLDGTAMTAREQAVPGEEIVDISGMYYDWDYSGDGTMANWGDGNMPYKDYGYVGDDEYVDVICWFDIETGYAYSLSAQAKDLDGFDIQAVAEQIYDPAKQISASIPD